MSEELTQQLPNDLLRQILARLDSMDARFGRMEQRLDSLDARLATLEEKVDRRLQETRPIWESVLEQLKEINARLDRIEKEIFTLRRWSRSTFAEMNLEHDKLEERVENVEARLAPQQETPTT